MATNFYDDEQAISLSPPEEYLAEVCVNEQEGVWCTVVLTKETTVQETLRKVRERGYSTYGTCLVTRDNKPVSFFFFFLAIIASGKILTTAAED